MLSIQVSRGNIDGHIRWPAKLFVDQHQSAMDVVWARLRATALRLPSIVAWRHR